MSDIPYKKELDPKTKAIAVIVVLLIVGMIFGFIISQLSLGYVGKYIDRLKNESPMIARYITDMYTLGTIFICTNIFLLLGLLGIYVDSFRKLKSSFIFGLILFIGVLLVQSIISLPILHFTVGYSSYNPSLFGILPNIFETLALVILLYLSME